MTDSSLDYLLGSYFHQDLYDVYGDEWGAVNTFIERDPHRVGAIPGEIAILLDSLDTEDDLAAYAARVGCEFRPDASDGGYRGWLTEIARRVREATRA